MLHYFVGVGAQKAGTTWLHDQLDLHPQIALPERKEIHYFDMVTRTRAGKSFGTQYLRAIRLAAAAGNIERVEVTTDLLDLAFEGDEAYRDYLARTQTRRTLVTGEITPSYATLTAEGFARMRDTLDDPKVIFVMRDPVTRCWSALRMAYPDGKRLENGLKRPIKRAGTWSRTDYISTIELLDEHFSDVLYLFFEDLFTEETLRRVASFLGVKETWPWLLDSQSRVSTPRDMPEPSASFLQQLQPIYDYVHDRFGDEVPSGWLH